MILRFRKIFASPKIQPFLSDIRRSDDVGVKNEKVYNMLCFSVVKKVFATDVWCVTIPGKGAQ